MPGPYMHMQRKQIKEEE